MARLDLGREHILAFRRRVGALDERLPSGRPSLRRAAWAGLQDSMPRAALLSLHARIEGIGRDILDDPSLVQVWGPRFGAYVVAAADRAPFTLGRFPDDERGRRRATDLAGRLAALLDGKEMAYGGAGRALGVSPNTLRYAAPTGTVLIRWDGARQPTVRSVPASDVDPWEARLDLARRYLHVFGPGTPRSFTGWAGLRPRHGPPVFEALRPELTPVTTPVGDGWILGSDEAGFRSPGPAAPARLLPSGDAYYLLWGADRQLLVPDAARRDELWTSRVWPGALLVEGEIVGTWKRSQGAVTLRPWRRLAAEQRDAVESETAALPLPGVSDVVGVWESPGTRQVRHR